MPLKLTKKEILKRINNTHGKKYKYIEINNKIELKDKIKIECKKHGQFIQQVLIHMKGSGCPKCGKESINKPRIEKAKKMFFKKIKTIFPKYDFSKFKYINSHTKSIVICNYHGRFKVTPGNLLNKHGCPKCKADKAIKLAKKRFFNEIPKNFDMYDFSKFEYINSKIKSEVICKIHGSFFISPSALRANKGCKKCGVEKCGGWNKIKLYKKNSIGKDFGIFYKLLFTHKKTKIKFIKIGITNRALTQRYINKEYKDFDYEVIDIWHGTNLECATKEKEYKQKNISKRFYIPEDIEFKGRTECYEYDKDQQLSYNGIKFIRESLILKQNNICPICKNKINKPTLDHHHKKRINGTGKCRGVLCATCNIFVGKIENNCVRYCIPQDKLSDVLRQIADFLELKQTKYIHPKERHFEYLSKSDFNKIKKYYFLIYPKRKIFPFIFRKKMKMTKTFIFLLGQIENYIENENKK